ncbi:MAG TPA: hypothetical protein VGE07_00330 [Herpetosiphonaceae bacterium]
MSLFIRPEPLIVVGAWMILSHILGGWRAGRLGLGVLGFGLFMVLKGWQELIEPRDPRLARRFLNASLAALAVASLDGLLALL